MISYQTSIIEKLRAAGCVEGPRALAQRLNSLAVLGERLRKRYENECSYEWANTLEYEQRTRKMEERAKSIAAAGGLEIYLQGDCRGATIYVDMSPIPDNAYNRSHCLTIESSAERRRRLAWAREQAK